MNQIVVTLHARDQAIARRHYGDLHDKAVTDAIKRDVRAAITAGRVLDHKPASFVVFSLGELRGKKPRAERMYGNQAFVHDERFRHGWIIARETNADVVLTSMQRVRAEASAA